MAEGMEGLEGLDERDGLDMIAGDDAVDGTAEGMGALDGDGVIGRLEAGLPAAGAGGGRRAPCGACCTVRSSSSAPCGSFDSSVGAIDPSSGPSGIDWR